MSLGDTARAHLRALAHPVRLRILSLLTGAQMSAAEVARELELTHANASYHLRHLQNAGLIEIAGEEKILGGVAKRYRYDLEKDLSQPVLPPEDSRPTSEHLLLYAAMATELQRRARQMRRSINNHGTDAELWVGESAWKQFRDQVSDASDDLHRAAVPPRTEGAIRVNATIALFEMES